jgi:hypothetical protein
MVLRRSPLVRYDHRMSSRSGSPVLANTKDPTPVPQSAVVPAGSSDDVPEHLLDDPFVRYMMAPPAEDIANLDALLEAGDLYGDDQARALADLLEGRHPLQRSSAAPR